MPNDENDNLGFVRAQLTIARWYLDRTGRNSTLWPDSVRAYRRRLARFAATDWRGEPDRASSHSTSPTGAPAPASASAGSA